MAKSGIYQIRCTVNGKRYIGSAVSIGRRWNQHRHQLRSGVHRNCYLQNAWLKYGEAAFAFEIIEAVDDRKQLVLREQHYLDRLAPEYNIAQTAGSRLGTKQSCETKHRISAGNKAAWDNPERQAVGAEVLRKRWSSPEARPEFGAAFKEKWADPEFRERMVSAQKAVWDDPEYRAQRLPSLRGARSPRANKTEYSIRNERGEVLIGIPFNLRQQTGLSSDSMSGLIRGRYKTAKGWRLANT